MLRYESFRKEILRWGDLHGSLEDYVSIAHLSDQATDGALETLLTAYLEQTRGNRADRTSGGLIKKLDEELAKSSQEVPIAKMSLRSKGVSEEKNPITGEKNPIRDKKNPIRSKKNPIRKKRYLINKITSDWVKRIRLVQKRIRLG